MQRGRKSSICLILIELSLKSENCELFAHDRKLWGAEEDCRLQGTAFLPLVAESFGGWHQCAEKEVKKLGSALARHTGQLEGEAIANLRGRLCILLQRGNAAIVGNRVPDFPNTEVDGNV